MTPHDLALNARLAILPFALVEWTVVFMYVKLMTRPQIARPLRVFLLAPFAVALLGTVFGQLNVYTAMTTVANAGGIGGNGTVANPMASDAFVLWVVVIENLLAAALLFRMAMAARRPRPPRGRLP